MKRNASSNAALGVAQYKGRKYQLLYCGQTKYGRRARLQFFDGSKDFWVDASALENVTVYGPQSAAPSSPTNKNAGPAPSAAAQRTSNFLGALSASAARAATMTAPAIPAPPAPSQPSISPVAPTVDISRDFDQSAALRELGDDYPI